jgi:hypothetical protein
VRGLPLVLGADLLAPLNLGIGSLLMVDLSNAGKDATDDDFGERVGLIWLAPGEMKNVLATSI